ncbi:hypothetical protein A2U01_0104949, partial [Trifolium medium]|nr:hypothetical protein [Trifolium medium]
MVSSKPPRIHCLVCSFFVNVGFPDRVAFALYNFQ